MRQWQKDALSVVREARPHVTGNSDTRLHLACSRAIEAMVMENGQVPSKLRLYARQNREHYGIEIRPSDSAVATQLAD